MTGLSIQLGKLNVGKGCLDSQFISPIHKTSAELCLSKIFSDYCISDVGKEIPFKIDIEKKILHVNGREISLQKSSELKRIERIVRCYQHADLLPRVGMNEVSEAFRAQKTQEAIKAINEASIPGANGQILAGVRIAEDSLSLTRNVIFALSSFGEKDPIGAHMGYYAGIFWTFFSLREIHSGWEEYHRSIAIGDSEGLRRSHASLLSGSLCSAASIAYLSGNILETAGLEHVAANALSTSGLLFGIGSLLAIGTSALGALRCYRFNDRLNEYLENPNLTEVERLKGALQFLKDSISITPEERDRLVHEINEKYPHWNAEQKTKLLEQKIVDLTESKVKYMKRRTSNKSLHLVLTRADDLLAKLKDPEQIVAGVKEATEVLHTVQQENKTKMGLYILGIIGALISSLAMIISIFLTAGTLPLILYGISGVIYLALSVYTAAGAFFHKKLEHQGVFLPICEEFPPYNPPVAV